MEPINVLLLGSGGRENAIAWKVSQSPLLKHLFIAPGNAGTAAFGTNLPIKPTDFDAVYNAVKEHNVELVIAGNEDPLVAGLREELESRAAADGRTLLILGPGKQGARLEGSKDFAKDFMTAHNIPTARHFTVTESNLPEGEDFLETLKAPYVLKADGLAAGKGVLIIDDLAQAKESLRNMLAGQFGAASAKVVIEEFLSGIECSVFVLTDGKGGFYILPPAKDYKRIGEGDTGLNTGGMGAICPPPIADEEFMSKVEERIILPTINGLIADGIDYRGFIFFGLIRCGNDPYVIEYNVRLGDPETEAVLPRIQSDLLEAMIEAAKGNLSFDFLVTTKKLSATVMAVAGGYPEEYRKGDVITGQLNPEESIVFHAGTKIGPDGKPVTNGGRVLTVTSFGNTIEEATAKSYKALENIHFDGMYFRRDIGRDLIDYAANKETKA